MEYMEYEDIQDLGLLVGKTIKSITLVRHSGESQITFSYDFPEGVSSGLAQKDQITIETTDGLVIDV